MRNVESIRVKFRPKQIKTLFVGESAPNSGKFFYLGDSNMRLYMEKALKGSFKESHDFLSAFKNHGWYLDDLVLTPINQLTPKERKAKCEAAQAKLALRIAEYRPEAIVCLLSRIDKFVRAAAIASGSDASFYSVPFPGMGHQKRFHAKIKKILPKLPKH
jgi:hypothetical protein